MRVQMIVSHGGYRSGEAVDLEDRIAIALIKSGVAVPVRVEPPETTAVRTGRR